MYMSPGISGFSMRNILMFAAVMMLVAGFGARFFDKVVVNPPAQAAVQSRPEAEPAYGRTLTLDGDKQGHFKVDARIEGRHIDFMVDTGASLVAIRESDAAQIGITPRASDYTATVSTANGKAKAAPVKIDRIDIGGITVYDVQAWVMPDAILWQNLLGVTFLSKLKRYEYANGRMVLEQ
jgi:aspartyl protease family protein